MIFCDCPQSNSGTVVINQETANPSLYTSHTRAAAKKTNSHKGNRPGVQHASTVRMPKLKYYFLDFFVRFVILLMSLKDLTPTHDNAKYILSLLWS